MIYAYRAGKMRRTTILTECNIQINKIKFEYLFLFSGDQHSFLILCDDSSIQSLECLHPLSLPLVSNL